MNRPRVLLGAAAVLVAATGYWWVPAALRPLSFFAVRRVEVLGTRYLSPAEVVAALGLRPRASVFDNLHELELRLSGLGGIERVRVSRVLPATLRVVVAEMEPVALAEGPDGLVPLAKDGRPLPYDVVAAPVDAPIVPVADRGLLEALRQVQATDPELYADVASARSSEGELVLDMTRGRVRLDVPVDPEIVRSVAAVRRTLDSTRVSWRELDGRFRGWVVVRKDGKLASGQDGKTTMRPAQASRRAAPRRPAPARRTAFVAPCLPASLPACRAV